MTITHRQSMQQWRMKRFPDRTSQYHGVSRSHHGKWRAIISGRPDGKSDHIGYFDTEIEAARAYDRVAFEEFGVAVYLNFPRQLFLELSPQQICPDRHPVAKSIPNKLLRKVQRSINAFIDWLCE